MHECTDTVMFQLVITQYYIHSWSSDVPGRVQSGDVAASGGLTRGVTTIYIRLTETTLEIYFETAML